MKKKVLFSILMAAVLVATAGCTSGGRKKKRSSGASTSQSSDPMDKFFENGFKGCIRIAGETKARDDAINEVDPATTLNKDLFAILTNKTKAQKSGSPEEYDMTLSYSYTITNGTSNINDYIEARIDNEDKSVIFFKGFPAVGTDLSACPIIKATVTGTINGDSRTKDYQLRLNPYDLKYHQMPISEIYAPATKCFDWMTEDFTTQGHETAEAGAFGPDVAKYADEGWWQNSENKKVHAAIETYGYITFISKDKNNAILECGNQAIQLYQVAEYAAWESTKDDVMNKPVVVRGELSGGFGNLQISYIREIFPAPSSISVAAPVTPTEFTEAMIGNILWSENPLFNKVFKATSVKYAGNVHQIHNKQGGEATVVDPEITGDALQSVDFLGSRYEFDVTIGSTTFTVQTDYHIIEVNPELAATLKTIVNKPVGSDIKIGGTVRWLNDRSVVGGNDGTTRTQGAWEIVPFLPEHAVAN